MLEVFRVKGQSEILRVALLRNGCFNTEMADGKQRDGCHSFAILNGGDDLGVTKGCPPCLPKDIKEEMMARYLPADGRKKKKRRGKLNRCPWC